MSKIVLKTQEEVRILFVRACAEQGWRNGCLEDLAKCLLRWPNGRSVNVAAMRKGGIPEETIQDIVKSSNRTMVGDWFDPTWLKKIEKNEDVVLDPSLFGAYYER